MRNKIIYDVNGLVITKCADSYRILKGVYDLSLNKENFNWLSSLNANEIEEIVEIRRGDWKGAFPRYRDVRHLVSAFSSIIEGEIPESTWRIKRDR